MVRESPDRLGQHGLRIVETAEQLKRCANPSTISTSANAVIPRSLQKSRVER